MIWLKYTCWVLEMLVLVEFIEYYGKNMPTCFLNPGTDSLTQPSLFWGHCNIRPSHSHTLLSIFPLNDTNTVYKKSLRATISFIAGIIMNPKCPASLSAVGTSTLFKCVIIPVPPPGQVTTTISLQPTLNVRVWKYWVHRWWRLSAFLCDRRVHLQRVHSLFNMF